MSRINELGIDTGQLQKLARTQSNVINDRTSLWTAIEREEKKSEPAIDANANGEPGEATTDTKDDNDDTSLAKHSYYGNADVGPAQRFHYRETSFATMVSFMTYPSDMTDSIKVNALRLSEPAMCMNTAECRHYRAIVPQPGELTLPTPEAMQSDCAVAAPE